MTLVEYFNKNYDITKKRKLINSKISHVDFYHKAIEELNEIKAEMIQPNKRQETLIEIGDLMCVCANWIAHHTDKPEEVINYVLAKNKKRIK